MAKHNPAQDAARRRANGRKGNSRPMVKVTNVNVNTSGRKAGAAVKRAVRKVVKTRRK